MHVAWVIFGAVMGLIVGSQFDAGIAVFGMTLGGFAGYTCAELASLRARNRELEQEINLMKERLAAFWRRQKESEQGPAQTEIPTRKKPAALAPASDAASSSTPAETLNSTSSSAGWRTTAADAPP